MHRRRFFQHSLGLAALSTLSWSPLPASSARPAPLRPLRPTYRHPEALDLSPASWIWYPCQRTLANSFFLFRRTFTLDTLPAEAIGWVLADSRYLLFVNGHRVQFGPAPADPRYPEADPIDLRPYLRIGENCIGLQVLFYGHGDGTWPTGKPGLLCQLDLEGQTLHTDAQWQVQLCRAWPPGHYKRWYLRALQEEFDARRYPYGWTQPSFQPDGSWLPAQELRGEADASSLANSADHYLTNPSPDTETEIRPRSLPLMQERLQPALPLVTSHRLRWQRPIEDFFDFVVPDAYEAFPGPAARSLGNDRWEVEGRPGESVVLTFAWPEQVVGWPYAEVEAPAGTVVEFLVQEAHVPFDQGGPALMNNHFNAWTRFTCREGHNRFETFDFESIRWLQIHLHELDDKARIGGVGVRQRFLPFSHQPEFRCSDPALTKLLHASVNTVRNSAQETLADGMGRERQQYSGDVGHELHALYSAFGETRLPARYLRTYSQGMTLDGFFLDTWPAYDRLNRLAQRQLGLTPWGPLLDHGIGFNFDCFHYYQFSGDLIPMQEVFPRLERFFHYLERLTGADDLLPVEDLGVPAVWMDTDAYQQQRHKQCAFNLYAVAMLRHAFGPLALAMEQPQLNRAARTLSDRLLRATQARYWDAGRGFFVNNQPWTAEEGGIRTCDRSLATAVLYDLCPGGQVAPAVTVLAELPDHLGRSYPANANWQLWALTKAGRPDAILRDFRGRWSEMASVHQNHTLQEAWQAAPDSGSQWSHAPVAPLFVTYQCLAGIEPLEPGCRKLHIRPQLHDLAELTLTYHTPLGAVAFSAAGQPGNRRLQIDLPGEVAAELWLNPSAEVDLPRLREESNWAVYALAAGQELRLSGLP